MVLFSPDAVAQARSDPGVGLLEALSTPTTTLLRSHTRFLSDDLLEGRAPCSDGGLIAARYLAAELEALGLLPMGPGEEFLQPVPLTAVRGSATLTIGAHQQTITLSPGIDFVAWPQAGHVPVAADGELVFVGYGIRAPEWGWDDFGTETLNGKVALVLSGEPAPADSTAFHGEQPTRYGTPEYKVQQAARAGARGVLLVRADDDDLPWSAIAAAHRGTHYFVDGRPVSNLEFAAWIPESTARRILSASARDFDLLVRRAKLDGFRPMSVGAHAVIRIRGTPTPCEAVNVVARVKGRDPVLSEQHVVLLAHYDHLGIGPPADGDSIYNGAESNASGVATLLAAAAGFAAASERPRRSVLFLATTAGEAGWWGARAFVADPPTPLEHIVAVVNIDRASVRGATRDIRGLGAEESGIEPYLQDAATAEQLSVAAGSSVDLRWFYRSDHLPFAAAGISTVLVRPGLSVLNRPDGWGAQEEARYLANQYRQPSDGLRGSWDYRGMLQGVRLIIRLGWVLAESEEFPTWAERSEFGAAAQQLRVRRMRSSPGSTNRR
jgi:hypothetical protein